MPAEISTLPEFEKQSFARWVYEAAERYFEDPEVMARFKKWEEEQNEKEENADASEQE